jgi:hypothetical protein
MSETLNHIASVSHWVPHISITPNQHIKTLETSGTLVGHQTVEAFIHTQILPSVCRFDIMCVLCYFPVVVVVVMMMMMMMECFPFTDLNN